MKRLILGAALLTACAPTKPIESNAQAPVEKPIERIILEKPQDLDARFDRLEKMIAFIANERAQYKAMISKYRACNTRCDQLYRAVFEKYKDLPDDERGSKILEETHQCSDECDQYRPDEVVGC